jgi:hypothetical protein
MARKSEHKPCHVDRRGEGNGWVRFIDRNPQDRHNVTQVSTVWWVRFRQHGRTVRQSTETTDPKKAERFLREREGKVALNIPVNVSADRLTLSDAAELIRNDYTANGRKSSDTLELRLTHLLAHFGAATRQSRITTGSVEQYKTARLAEPVTTCWTSRDRPYARDWRTYGEPYVVRSTRRPPP